jgi:hypothetical protein
MVWVGIGWQLWKFRVARTAAIAAGIAFLLLVAPARIGRDLDYHRAGTDATRLLNDLSRFYPAPRHPIAIGPRRIFRNGVPGLIGGFDTSSGLQLVKNDKSVEAYWTADEREFAEAPTPLRFDVLKRRPVPAIETNTSIR